MPGSASCATPQPMGRPSTTGLRACRYALAAVTSLTAGLTTSPAQAEPANGWLHLGGGALVTKHGADVDPELASTMLIDMGLGTEAHGPFIFGGLFRIQPVFEHGVDLALMARAATTSFQTSYIGFALDAGAYQRWWGLDSTGFIGQGVLGGPFGLQLSVMASVGTRDSWGVGTALGIDLARLTVHRDHLLDWWPNPKPSDGISAAMGAGH